MDSVLGGSAHLGADVGTVGVICIVSPVLTDRTGDTILMHLDVLDVDVQGNPAGGHDVSEKYRLPGQEHLNRSFGCGGGTGPCGETAP